MKTINDCSIISNGKLDLCEDYNSLVFIQLGICIYFIRKFFEKTILDHLRKHRRSIKVSPRSKAK